MKKGIAITGLFTALTIAGAQIVIPIGPVPFTLQVLFVLLSGMMLGSKLGALSQIVYVIMGAMGFPVFAGFRGGLVHLIGPTGGFLLAFPIAAYIAGLNNDKFKFSSFLTKGSLGLGVIYLLGWGWLAIYLKDPLKSFFVGVVPFIMVDFIKLLLATYITMKFKQTVSSSLKEVRKV